MAKETGKNPETLADEALDQAAGGLGEVDGKTRTAASSGFLGGVYVGVAVGDVNNDLTRKIADGSVKPAA